MSKIVLENFSEGNGYYKVNLAYLNKEQVEEIESLVSKWKPTNEHIKDCIRMCLTDANEQRFKTYGTTFEDCLAWLEKQGKMQSTITWHSASEIPDEQRELLCEWESEDATWHDIAFYHANTNDFWNGSTKIEGVTKWVAINELLEKQGDQELSQVYEAQDGETITYSESEGYKIAEPKFKNGDWVISKYMHLIMQILNNDNGYYKTVETDGTERNDSYDFIERNFKLWTIEDAKEGDILFADDWIVIFRPNKYPQPINEPRFYCHYDIKYDCTNCSNFYDIEKDCNECIQGKEYGG